MKTETLLEEQPGVRAGEIVVSPPTPMTMIQLAVQRGADIGTIERLVALQEKMLALEAEEQFNEAMNRAQEKLHPVRADADNPQTKSKYASYSALDRACRPIYANEGFSLSFNTADSPLENHVRILCYCSRGRHTRTYQVDMPNDGKGAKGGDVMTKTHATGAAMSYGMRYLLKYIFNIAVGEEDTDGNIPSSSMPDLEERLEWIANCKDENELRTVYTVAYKAAAAAGDKQGMARLIAAKDAKRREF